jgi:hypothetical protein
MPEEKPSSNPNIPFPTPNPNDLQSEEDKASVREHLAQESGTETHVVEDQFSDADSIAPNSLNLSSKQINQS